MSELNDFIADNFEAASEITGTTDFTIGDSVVRIPGVWNELGRTEEIELSGRRVRFSVYIEAAKRHFSAAPIQGQKVTRLEDGKIFRIVGEVETDSVVYRFALDTVHR